MSMFPSFRAPETMTAAEQAALLRATAAAQRDHLLYSMALGTGLRLRELLGLDVGDVSPDGREVRRQVSPSSAVESPHDVKHPGRPPTTD